MKDHHQYESKLRQTLILLSLLFLTINAYGTLGFMIIEQAPFLDAFYMTVITITTVGFQEVFPLSDLGRLFAITCIYTGLISSGFSVAILANFFVEETVLELVKGKNKEKRVNKLKNHFIVCGYGTTGQGIVSDLLSQGSAVVVIDIKPTDLPQHCFFIEGDARQDGTLGRAGIGRAQGLASTLSEDADNVFVVLSARALKPELRIVSRFKEDDTEHKLVTAGANHVLSPYRIGGHHLASALTNSHSLEDQKPPLKEGFHHLKIPQTSLLVGKQLGNSYIQQQATGALIVAIIDKKGATIFNPEPDYQMEQAAQLLVLGGDEQVRSLRHFLEHAEQP